MALPSKVVDQLSRAPARTPGWSSRVLLFSATFFILSTGIFLGIQFGYRPFLEGQSNRIDREIAEFSKKVPEREQEELVSFYSQLDNLTTLLAKQTMPSKVFEWLENNTNVNVQLSSLALNTPNRTITIAGQARSVVTLGEQLNRFRAQSEIKNVQLSQLTLDQKNGIWTFSIVLTAEPQLFAPNQIAIEDYPAETESGESILPDETSTTTTSTAVTTPTSSTP